MLFIQKALRLRKAAEEYVFLNSCRETFFEVKNKLKESRGRRREVMSQRGGRWCLMPLTRKKGKDFAACESLLVLSFGGDVLWLRASDV